MVPYGGDMVCVVGGYGYPIHRDHTQKGASYHTDFHTPLFWTNEVHLFQFSTGIYIVYHDIHVAFNS